MKYEKFLDLYTDLVFVEHKVQKADVILIPGSGYPQLARRAALLYRQGLAPLVLPSGRYSKLTGRFEGAMAEKEQYDGTYETEWEFLAAALEKNGVPKEAILREDKATYTYENALCSARVLKEKGIAVKKAIICCQAFHARRCQLYYQLAFPDTQLILDPVDTGVCRENWYRTEEGIRLVLGEAQRYGAQFYEIMEEIRKSLEEDLRV